MPWVYNNGSGTPPSYTWTGTNYQNQDCSAISIPEGAVTQLKCFCAGYGGAVIARLAIWDAGGGVKSQSESFYCEGGSASVGGQYWYTVSCAPTLVNGTYWVGIYRNPSGGHIVGTTTSGGGTQYRRTNTSGFPSIWGMESHETQNKSIYVGVFYITKPANITSASVSRNSDTSQTVSWTNNSSSDAPYSGIWVDRWDNVSNNWYNIATIGGSNSSFTDTTTSANKQYRYRVLAYNDAGNTGSHTYTGYIDTTPAAPTNVVANRVTSTVVITWTNSATNETSLTLQRREYSGGSWGAYTTINSPSADATQYIDTSPVPVGQYKIRTNNATLSSAYAVSNEIVSITAPNPPTSLLPNYSFDGANVQRFSWLHNSVDGTTQSKFSLQYRVSGGSFPATPQYNETVSTNNYIDIPAETFTNDSDYEWQVKTWGQSATGSDWSDIASFTPYATPVVTITSPSSVADYITSLLLVNWTYTQADDLMQIQYIAKLYDSSDVLLESVSLPSNIMSGSTTIATFLYNLANNTTYKITVEAQSGSGQWSILKDVTFDTVFAVPSAPTFVATFDLEKTAVNIDIVNPSPSELEVEAIYNNVYRKINGNVYELILTNVPINTTVIDYLPNIKAINYYYIEAVSATPTTAVSTESSLTIGVIGLFVFNSRSDYCILKGDVNFGEKRVNDIVLKKFEGRTYPVKYNGTSKEFILDFSSDLLMTEYNALIDIIESSDTIYYRDYLGRRFQCSVDNISISKKDNLAYQFSCTISRVEGG